MKDLRPMNADKRISLFVNLAWWLGASLIAITALEWSAPLGLAFAALGGVGLGVLLFRDDSR